MLKLWAYKQEKAPAVLPMLAKITLPPSGQIEKLRPLFIYNTLPPTHHLYNFVCFTFEALQAQNSQLRVTATKLTCPPGGQIKKLRPLFVYNATHFI